MTDFIYQIFDHDSDGSRLIGTFLDKESAIDCLNNLSQEDSESEYMGYAYFNLFAAPVGKGDWGSAIASVEFELNEILNEWVKL
jgi:hypothetical protein